MPEVGSAECRKADKIAWATCYDGAKRTRRGGGRLHTHDGIGRTCKARARRAVKKGPLHQRHVPLELGLVDGLGGVPTHSVFACRGIQTVHRHAPRSTGGSSQCTHDRSMSAHGPGHPMARPPLRERRRQARGYQRVAPLPNPQPQYAEKTFGACTQGRRQRASLRVRRGQARRYIVSMSRTGLGPAPPPSADPIPPGGTGMRTCVRRPVSRRAPRRRQPLRLDGAAWLRVGWLRLGKRACNRCNAAQGKHAGSTWWPCLDQLPGRVSAGSRCAGV